MDERECFMRDLIFLINNQTKINDCNWDSMSKKEKEDSLKIAQGMFNLGWAKQKPTGVKI